MPIPIVIAPPYTLNKWRDESSPTRTPNEFQELTNYIPDVGQIYTREGMTLFTHTPETTVGS